MMSLISACSAVFLLNALHIFSVTAQSFNPTILQDSRDLPKVDGTFGFLYRTEDGIAHAAKGDSDGIIHGRFTYTDPTGLKVNFNYNAGSRVAPGYNYDDQAPVSKYRNNRPSKYSNPAPPLPPPPQPAAPAPVDQELEYQEQPEINQPQYRRPSPRRQHQFRDAADVYQERRRRPSNLRNNEIYDYNYRN